MAKKKQGRSQKRRSERKVLDAFHLAERAENGSGSGSEDLDNDDLQVRDGIMDARKFQKNAGDGNEGLEDEELDSDEAMGSDDDYDVLSTKFSHTLRAKNKKTKQKNKKNGSVSSESESDDAESDDGYHSVDESQFVPLSEAWDMDDRDLAASKRSSDVVLDDAWDTESLQSESGSESGSESDSEANSESDSESEDEEAMLRGSDADSDVDMAHTVSKVRAGLKTAIPRHKKLVSETVAENEYSVPTGGHKLSLADMMAAADPAAAPLVTREPDAEDESSRALAVPLPRHIQERNNRKVAYEITKQEVARWQESVRALQDADHTVFPLPAPAVEEQEEVDEDAQAEAEYEKLRAVPALPEDSQKSALEEKVKGLLQAGALLDESNEATFEQLQLAKLSKEELFRRTAELRRMRELMFRDEQRAKRIKKIKSKQFRKIRKRERLRDADLVEGEEGEGESDPEDHDMRRAEERMSLRHKTQSKWAKNMIKSGITKDASSRAELEEMLRAGERLRARQLGHADGEQSDTNISDIERDYANDDADDVVEAEANERSRLGKGVLAMDFMKAAEERKRKENIKEIEFLKTMGNSGIEEFENSPADMNSINQLKNQGRRVYAPAVAAAKEEIADIEDETLRDFRDDDAKNLESRLAGRKAITEVEDEPPAKRQRVEEQEFTGFDDEENIANGGNDNNDSDNDNDNNNDEDEDDDDANPWLTAGEAPVNKSKKFSTVTEDSSKLDKAANKISKHTSKKSSNKQKQADTYIDLDKVMNISGNVMGSEDEEDESDPRMFRQQTLIQEAFAGDDVVSEFLDEKKQVIADEDDKEEDLTLPGWGGWGGAENTAKPKKKFVRKIDGVAQKDKRRDRNLENVIVNESVNKHNLKYQSSSVPFPYESREQYERALRMPVGEEWSSRATHQKTILPRVIVKQGVVIDPMKAPFK